MKKILLSTTAIIGAVAFVSSASADAPSAKLGAKVNQYVATGKKDGSANNAGWTQGGPNYANEFYISGKGSTDDGLTYGAKIDQRMDRASKVDTDEIYVHVGGDWGTITLGQNDGAADDNIIYGGSVAAGSGGWDGVAPYFLADQTLNDGFGSLGTGDAGKIRYDSASIGGLGVSASIAPSADSVQNLMELALTYGMNAGDTSIDIAFALESGTANDKSSGVKQHDHQRYSVGAKVGFGPVSAAFGYSDFGKHGVTGKTDGSDDSGGSMSAGIGYDLGGGSAVSLTAASGSKKLNKTQTAKSTAYSLEFGTKVADGMTAYVDVNMYQNDKGTNATGSKTNATGFVVGTQISF